MNRQSDQPYSSPPTTRATSPGPRAAVSRNTPHPSMERDILGILMLNL